MKNIYFVCFLVGAESISAPVSESISAPVSFLADMEDGADMNMDGADMGGVPV